MSLLLFGWMILVVVVQQWRRLVLVLVLVLVVLVVAMIQIPFMVSEESREWIVSGCR